MERATKETSVEVGLVLDGSGRALTNTGMPFLDHMLQALARFSGFDLEVEAKGDLGVDGHHTAEDVGIVLGQALSRALGDRSGIRRYGWSCLPMDEALVLVSLDLSGRPYLGWDVPMAPRAFGDFHSELAVEFWRAFVNHGGVTMHARLLAGSNTHHILEAVWKACGVSLGQAVQRLAAMDGPLSTKGVLG